MPPRRRVDVAAGEEALGVWRAAGPGEDVPRATIATAVRYSLEELATLAPGRSVEVRVPPYGAVQCIEGLNHHRGTLPNVVEMAPAVWLHLATGRRGWTEALETGVLQASGSRADLSGRLPVWRPKAVR